MSLKNVRDALAAGNVPALQAALRRTSVDWSAPQGPQHPVWAVVAQLVHPSDYPWSDVWPILRASGMPADPLIQTTAHAWESPRTGQREAFRAGCLKNRVARPPLGTLLGRSIRTGCLPAVRALLRGGADPGASPPVGLDESPWHHLPANHDQALVQALVRETAELPATRVTARWLAETAEGWPPDHPVWSVVPSETSWWDDAVAVWGDHHARALAAWWLARPQDREPLRQAAVRHDSATVWPAVLWASAVHPSLLSEERSRHSGADGHLTLPLFQSERGSKNGRRRETPVPPLQWLRHHERHSAGRVPTAALALLADLFPAWTSAGEGPMTEGELAQLASDSPLAGNDAVWQAHPEWWAPHARTGRTPLWHACDADGAQVWWRRGCALDAVDAEGNQVFAVLVARSLLAGPAGSELGTWALERLKDGSAPLGGSAWGRTLEEWVVGRKDLASAWARRAQREPTVSGSSELIVRCYRLDRSRVRELLSSGADPNGCDANGISALRVVCEASPRGDKGKQDQLKLMRLLVDSGAPIADRSGVSVLDRTVTRLREYRTGHIGLSGHAREVLALLVAFHDEAGLPWTDEAAWLAMRDLGSGGFRALPAPLSARTVTDWCTRLLNPDWGDPDEMGDEERVNRLGSLLSDHQHEVEAGAIFPAFQRWAVELDRPERSELREAWGDLLEKTPALRAWWESLCLESALPVSGARSRLRL